MAYIVNFVLAQAAQMPVAPPDNGFGWLATLGVGGALAWGMFQVYRKDVKQFTELWKVQSEMLMRVVVDNTAAITALRADIANQSVGRRAADRSTAESAKRADGI